MSMICKGLVSASWAFVGVSLILALSGKITALAWLNCFSYIKLGVTLIKCVQLARRCCCCIGVASWARCCPMLGWTG